MGHILESAKASKRSDFQKFHDELRQRNKMGQIFHQSTKVVEPKEKTPDEDLQRLGQTFVRDDKTELEKNFPGKKGRKYFKRMRVRAMKDRGHFKGDNRTMKQTVASGRIG